MDYRDVVITEREKIYNDLSFALTDFESDMIDNKKFETINYHIGKFYAVLCNIQNRWEDIITSQVD